MSILEYLFDNPIRHPLSPRGLQGEMAARSTTLARRIGALNRKRKDELESLRSALARLMLVVETQQRLLLQKGLCTPKEFEEMLRAIDLEDGAADGQLRRR
jgi:hypothetical protein